MNKNFFTVLLLIGVASSANTALAHPWYSAPAKAFTCSDCHVGGTRSKQFVPGIIESFPIDQSLLIQDKIKAIFALTHEQKLPSFAKIDAQINPKPSSPDTAPTVKPDNTFYNVMVGEKPVLITFTVTDAEKDTFTLNGPGLIPTTPTPYDAAKSSSSFSYTWTPEADYAGLTLPIVVSVRENQRPIGRFLPSNTATANVTVWPARANAKTALVEQFDIQNAKWSDNTLILSGNVAFKGTVSPAAKADALASLKLSATSQKGKAVGSAPVLEENGAWSLSLPATESQVPCTVVLDYEGLKAKRPVKSAPRTACVK
jgi:hypothetical protein